MSDPRTAVLAQAIRDEIHVDEAHGFPADATPESVAAAILAALPADWCGHDDLALHERDLAEIERDEAEAEIARLRAAHAATVKRWTDLAAERTAECEELDAEIARLRRLFIESYCTVEKFPTCGDPFCVEARAALEKDQVPPEPSYLEYQS